MEIQPRDNCGFVQNIHTQQTPRTQRTENDTFFGSLRSIATTAENLSTNAIETNAGHSGLQTSRRTAYSTNYIHMIKTAENAGFNKKNATANVRDYHNFLKARKAFNPRFGRHDEYAIRATMIQAATIMDAIKPVDSAELTHFCEQIVNSTSEKMKSLRHGNSDYAATERIRGMALITINAENRTQMSHWRKK